MNTDGKYVRHVYYWDEGGTPHHVHIDVYDVLKAYDVRCPAIQHAVKKLLCCGILGHKDADEDLREAMQAIQRAVELNTESRIEGGNR